MLTDQAELARASYSCLSAAREPYPEVPPWFGHLATLHVDPPRTHRRYGSICVGSCINGFAVSARWACPALAQHLPSMLPRTMPTACPWLAHGLPMTCPWIAQCACPVRLPIACPMCLLTSCVPPARPCPSVVHFENRVTAQLGSTLTCDRRNTATTMPVDCSCNFLFVDAMLLELIHCILFLNWAFGCAFSL